MNRTVPAAALGAAAGVALWRHVTKPDIEPDGRAECLLRDLDEGLISFADLSAGQHRVIAAKWHARAAYAWRHAYLRRDQRWGYASTQAALHYAAAQATPSGPGIDYPAPGQDVDGLARCGLSAWGCDDPDNPGDAQPCLRYPNHPGPCSDGGLTDHEEAEVDRLHLIACGAYTGPQPPTWHEVAVAYLGTPHDQDPALFDDAVLSRFPSEVA